MLLLPIWEGLPHDHAWERLPGSQQNGRVFALGPGSAVWYWTKPYLVLYILDMSELLLAQECTTWFYRIL